MNRHGRPSHVAQKEVKPYAQLFLDNTGFAFRFKLQGCCVILCKHCSSLRIQVRGSSVAPKRRKENSTKPCGSSCH